MGLNRALTERIESMNITDPLTRRMLVNVSGCPNSCGQHHLGKIRRAQGVQGAGAAQHAGIVKRAIQPAKPGDGGVHQARVFGFHGDVGRACPGLAACRAHLGGHVFQQVGAPRRQGQLRARTAQEPRGGGANARRRASDQKALASQVSQKRGHVMRSCVGKIVHTG